MGTKGAVRIGGGCRARETGRSCLAESPARTPSRLRNSYNGRPPRRHSCTIGFGGRTSGALVRHGSGRAGDRAPVAAPAARQARCQWKTVTSLADAGGVAGCGMHTHPSAARRRCRAEAPINTVTAHRRRAGRGSTLRHVLKIPPP